MIEIAIPYSTVSNKCNALELVTGSFFCYPVITTFGLGFLPLLVFIGAIMNVSGGGKNNNKKESDMLTDPRSHEK